jgi:hypothetical protein
MLPDGRTGISIQRSKPVKDAGESELDLVGAIGRDSGVGQFSTIGELAGLALDATKGHDEYGDGRHAGIVEETGFHGDAGCRFSDGGSAPPGESQVVFPQECPAAAGMDLCGHPGWPPGRKR